MAAIKFYTDTAGIFDIYMFGSGLGFYGAGNFGTSVAVDSYQDNTFVTDGDGTDQGPQANNVKWTHSTSGEIPTANNLLLQYIPNAQSTVNIRFTNVGTPVQVQNAELRIYDRSDITLGASGVTTKAYECLHIAASDAVQGSGLTTWTTPVGSGVTLALVNSPGESGLYAGTVAQQSIRPDERHDWYVCLSARPDSIGSKTEFGMYVALEYL